MSKSVEGAFTQLLGIKNAVSKFSPSAKEGSRLIPSKIKDAQIPIRIDADHYNPETKGLNVVLQVNSQTKVPGLVEWRKKNTSHGKLATETFDTSAKDKDAELRRMLESMKEEAKENLK